MKKLVALLLAAVLVLGLMTACGKENNDPDWSSGNSERPQQTQPQQTEEVASDGEIETYPATDGDLDDFDYSTLPASDGDLNG